MFIFGIVYVLKLNMWYTFSYDLLKFFVITFLDRSCRCAFWCDCCTWGWFWMMMRFRLGIFNWFFCFRWAFLDWFVSTLFRFSKVYEYYYIQYQENKKCLNMSLPSCGWQGSFCVFGASKMMERITFYSLYR